MRRALAGMCRRIRLDWRGGLNVYEYAYGNPMAFYDPSGEMAPLIAMGMGAVLGGGIDLLSQLIKNGGNIHCVDFASVSISALSSISLGLRFGYKATLESYKVIAKSMTKKEAFDLRKKIKREYRIFKRVDDILSKRDRPFEKVRDPIDSFARTNARWDLVSVVPGAIKVGSNVGNSAAECGC